MYLEGVGHTVNFTCERVAWNLIIDKTFLNAAKMRFVAPVLRFLAKSKV